MSTKLARLCIAMATLTFMFMVSTRTAEASIITFNFSGTVDTSVGPDVFGQSGTAVPFNVSLTYDTSLNTNSVFLPAGTNLGPFPLAHDLYGYSASGVTSTNVTFGTQTWTAADLQPITLGLGISAELYMDTDLNVSPPTRFFAAFGNDNGVLYLGNLGFTGQLSLFNTIDINDASNNGLAHGAMTFATSTPQAVPEPATLLLFGTGLIGLSTRRVRRG